MSNSAHWSSKGLVVAAFYPLLWLSLFYAFVFRARTELGYWPRYSQPDPKDLDFTFHHLLLHYGILILPVIALVAIWFAMADRAQGRRVPIWLVVSAGLAPILLAIYLNLEPHDFIGWFLD